jgi:predicted porin
MRSTYILAAALVLVPLTGQAQKSNTRGFMANLHYSRTSLKTEDADKTDMGNGVGVRLGWGFSPSITAYAGLAASKLIIEDPGADGDYGLGQFDIGVTYNFAKSTRALVPYLELALSSQAIAYSSVAGDFSQTGTGFTFGGGINYYFSRSTALQVGLNFTGSSFDDGEIDGSKIADSGGKASGGRLMIGFTFYPMKK